MSGDVQTRKRKDKKRRKGDSDFERLSEYLPKTDDEENLSSAKEDTDDADDKYSHASHHGSNVGFLSCVVFVLLLTGLVALTALIFFELQGSSKEVETPIAESRYASFLGDFVDEHVNDEDEDIHSPVDGDHGHDEHEDEDHHEHDDRGHDEHDDEEFHDRGHEDHDEDVHEQDDHGHEEYDEVEHHEQMYSPPEEVHDEDVGAEVEDSIDRTWEENAIPDEPVGVPVEEHGDENIPEEESFYPPEPPPSSTESFEDVEEVAVTPEETQPEESTEPTVESDAPEEVNPQLASEEPEGDVHQVTSPLEDAEEERLADAPVEYVHADVTNDYDFQFRDELDEADNQIEQSPGNAKAKFEAILSQHPSSPRALYGKARVLDRLSEAQRSNSLLEESIEVYRVILNLPDVPDRLFRDVAERCVDRMRFRGFIGKAIGVQQTLIRRFPNEVSFQNQMAVSYLLMGQSSKAGQILSEVLGKFPSDGFAKVHYGFILKTEEKKYKEAIKLMREGIATGEPGTADGRFYFHLGDALTRVGHPEEALQVYEDGVVKGLFRSAYQRSLYNVDTLTGRPWWSPEQTTYLAHLELLEKNWKSIRDEGMALLDEEKNGFIPEAEGLRDTGVWKQFELFARGRKLHQNCAKAPNTCKLVEGISDAAGCSRGQVKFSIMHPKTHIWAHTGPTNCRIRAHLGLVVPQGVRIRVANETREWIEGRFIVFDDSFEHEVWHNGDTFRLVLIVDFWHPELTSYQKRTLPPI